MQRFLHAIVAAIAIVLTVGLMGCPPRPAHRGDALAKSLPGAASTVYTIDIDALESVLPSTLSDLEWAAGRIRNRITTLHATGLTSDDRPIEIRAQQQDEGDSIQVQVKVGPFGNVADEQRFHQALQRRVQAYRSKQTD